MFKRYVIKRSLAAAAVIATVGFPPTAQAMLINGGGGSSGPAASGSSAPQPIVTPQSSFQWDDAGIGAAGVLVLLGAGTTVSVIRRRHPRRQIAS